MSDRTNSRRAVPRQTEEAADRVAETQKVDVPVETVALLETPLGLAHNQLGDLGLHEDENVNEKRRNERQERQPRWYWSEWDQPAASGWVAG